ncbi:MAG: ribosome maturation factor RimM [Bacteroidia bacterium]
MTIQKDDCFYFGIVMRAHGRDGTVVVAMDVDQPDYYKSLNEAYIFLNDTLVRFAITAFNIQRDAALIRFENVNNHDDAALITGCEIYLPLTKLPPLTGNQFYFHEIIGYTLIDNNFGEVGTVNQIFDMPQQAIAQVFHGDKEVLVPLKLDMVTEIDRVNKKLVMSLPEGLVELYIS